MSHVFLTGFMGAGKSTVGRLVAAELGWPFVDLDRAIEHREGASVSSIFTDRGESEFRQAEHAALAALAATGSSVIATGGGVVLREDNQTLLRQLGTVVYLSVTPEEAIARLGDAGDRPLLAGGGLDAARAVLAARLAVYAATADAVVDTVGRTPEETAAAVLAALPGELTDAATPVRIRVGGAGDSTYEVIVGPGVVASLGERVLDVTGARSAIVVSDTAVWPLHGPRVVASLAAAGIRTGEYVVPSGELSKSWPRAGELLEYLATWGLDRTSVVVALGGGVVGDLAGFVAATYMRGIGLVHVPTTLLAQVDSAIGGKTAVDLTGGKNLAGAFWPPRLVLSDTDTLSTLPAAEWTNGLAEVVKSVLLAGGAALARFEHEVEAVIAREPDAVLSAVIDAARFKAGVVSADLREADVRECLNLGHTLGHALERLVGYGELPHGLAVAEGMRFAATLAATVENPDPDLSGRTAALLEAIGAGAGRCAAVLRGHLPALTPEALLSAMKGDKKSRNGQVRFVLLLGPGTWKAVGVEDAVLLAALERWSIGMGG